jgi:16S rRNA (cytosine967-C5)-methyltransferase
VAREAPFDLVLADAPCSGSGSWRRDPEGKWRLTQERLDELCALQARIMDSCAGLVSAKGRLAYATCSLLEAENHSQAAGFLVRHPGWHLEQEHRLTPLQGGDGFYLAILARG